MQAAGPADEPRRGLEALADLAGLHRNRRQVREERAQGHVLLRLGLERLQRHDRPAQPRLLRRQGQRDRRHRTRRSRRPGTSRWQGIAKGESAGLAAFSTSWNTGFKESAVRHRHLPRVDDGLYPGPGPELGRRLGHRRGSGRRRQLGRLVPRRPEAVEEPGPRARAGQVPDLAGLRRRTCSSRRATCRASRRCSAIARDCRTSRTRSSPNAPVGKIFASSVKALKPQITGPHQGDIQTASSNAIQRVEQKKQSAAASWQQFLKDVANVAT